MSRRFSAFFASVTLACLLLAQACNIINPDEQEPAYLRIDSINVVSTDFEAHGSVSSNITDAWVFVNDTMLGIFELPATIPVLAQGEQDLLIGPGIIVSTLSELRDNYLFYDAFRTTFDFKPGEIQEIEPFVTYREEANQYVYLTVDDFDDVDITFNGFTKSNGSDTNIVVTRDPNEVFEGRGSGVIDITPDMNFVQIQTSAAYTLPQQGNIVYMELDYKTDTEFTLGVFINNISGQDQTIDYVTFRDTGGEWKKAYMALTSLISNGFSPEDYIFYFRARLPADGGVTGQIMIDNVKLMIES